MIDVSEVILDPDFKPGSVTVTRRMGEWNTGRFETVDSVFTLNGATVNPMKTEDIVKLPNGDTITGAILIHSFQPVYTTKLTLQSGEDGNLSDEITWKGKKWDVISVEDYSEYGYYKAIGVRKQGA